MSKLIDQLNEDDDSEDEGDDHDDAKFIDFGEFCELVWPVDGYFCEVPAFGGINDPLPQQQFVSYW
jgi:hypothetical protein